MYSEEVLPDNLASIAAELAESGDLETASETESEIGTLARPAGAQGRGADPSAARLSTCSTRRRLGREGQRPGVAGERSRPSRAAARGDRGGDRVGRHGRRRLGLDDLAPGATRRSRWRCLQSRTCAASTSSSTRYAIARDLESYDGAMIEHNYGVGAARPGRPAGGQRRAAPRQERARAAGPVVRHPAGRRARLRACSTTRANGRRLARSPSRVIAAADGTRTTARRSRHTRCVARIGLATRQIRSRRGSMPRRALALAREIGEPQYFVPRSGSGRSCTSRTAADRAAELLAELLDGGGSASRSRRSRWPAPRSPPLRYPASVTFVDATSAYPLPSRWVQAAHLLAAGCWKQAAAVYADIGSLPNEALARTSSARSAAS